jgi:DNA repair exonuclease SbcCD ATPase subunit
MINFQTIRWKNFLSTGSQFTEVKLNKSTTTLIVGENGAGKSTILDALCFTLFGKPFRNINKPQLVNSINQKQLQVEVEFNIGSKHYHVIRGIKPNVFEIKLNGVLVNQDAASRDYQKYLEEHVLKLNYKSFTQIVILGSASFTPFMQLPASHRREVIEDLLDIKVFSTMNDVLKDKYNEIKVKISDLDNKIEVGKQKVKLQQEYIKTLEDDKKKREDDVQKQIHDTTEEVAQLTMLVSEEKQQQLHLESSINDAETKRSLRTKMEALLRSLADRIKTQKKQIEFYHEHDICPTCSQDLTTSIREEAVHRHESTIQELQTAVEKLQSQYQDTQARLDEIVAIETKISEHQDRIIDLNSQIIGNQKLVQSLQQTLQSTSLDTVNVEEEKANLKQIAKTIVEFSNTKTGLVEEKHYLDIAGLLLKDTGIKTTIIRQYLPAINKLVNKFLQAMDFFVTFELDEAFNEKIKSRHRDDFSYASFSEGEKAKIDLALLFAWRSIARMKNSANTNLLLLDEVFDGSLDVNGTDYVMTILNTIGEENNIFIISHKDALFDKFRSVIRFEKVNNFSRIAL